MFRNWLFRDNATNPAGSSPTELEPVVAPLTYSWILTGKLAIGPMPRSSLHWLQLENDGFTRRFSCCYSYENIFVPVPGHWSSCEISLPDHRSQDELTLSLLASALTQARLMIVDSSKPLYLHCFAGQERSALMAVGLVCLLENKNLFDSLSYVRQCHKSAKPIYTHLDLLDQLLATGVEKYY